MRELEATELQTQRKQVLDDVQHGEAIVITRHGRRVARIVPEADRRREDIQAAMREIKEFRRSGPRLSIEEILAWRHEGHKY